MRKFAARLMKVPHAEVRWRVVESVKSLFVSATPRKQMDGTSRPFKPA